MKIKNDRREIIVLGGGCFWCTEAVFKMLRGVISVVPGYAGGTKTNPTYEEVARGNTGHAEAIKAEYNAENISFHDVLTVFFGTHDPTTLNRQGNDAGPQYRSAIFYTTEKQRTESETFIKSINDSNPNGAKVVTELKPLDIFYEAENYHKDYFSRNKENAYCELVINPKLEKVQRDFASLLSKTKSHE